MINIGHLVTRMRVCVCVYMCGVCVCVYMFVVDVLSSGTLWVAFYEDITQ